MLIHIFQKIVWLESYSVISFKTGFFHPADCFVASSAVSAISYFLFYDVNMQQFIFSFTEGLLDSF